MEKLSDLLCSIDSSLQPFEKEDDLRDGETGLQRGGAACPKSAGKQLSEPRCLLRCSSSKSIPWQGTARCSEPPGTRVGTGGGGAVLKRMFLDTCL